uniref:Uncharacterized protein LOC102802880 n=1 Tax=Saccoglossus kowalevskii TaxID=10224 RepID=A0ABM0LZV8_SACKO|nr:PREDICTED: uncharacterized protein LOC102802880 [Saccoglossus kowalevskii]
MSRVSHAWIAMLRQNRLDNFINAFRSLGVENTDDLLDVFNDDLLSLGMTKIQRNRFNRMCSELRGDDKTTDSILPRGILSPTSNNSTSTNSQDIQSPHTFHQGQCQQLESGLSSSDVWSPPAIGQGLHRPIETGLSSHNVLTSPSIRQDNHQPMISPNVQSSQAIGQSLHRSIESNLSSHDVLTSPSIRQDHHQPMISSNVQSSQAIGQSLHRPIESGLSSHDVLSSSAIGQDHQPLKASLISPNVQSSSAIGQDIHQPIESGLSSHNVLTSSAIGQDHQPLKASFISPNVQSSSAIGQDLHRPIESGLSSHNILTSSANGQDHQPLKASLISPNVQSSQAIGQDLHQPIESGLSSHNVLTSSAIGQDHQPLKASLISPNVQSSQAIGQDLHRPIESGLSSHNVLTSSAIGQDHQPRKASLISPNVQSSPAIGQDLHRPIESGLSSHNVLTSPAIWQDHQPMKASFISPNVQFSPAIGQALHQSIKSSLSIHDVKSCPASGQDLHQPIASDSSSHDTKYSSAVEQDQSQSLESSLCLCDVKSPAIVEQGLHQPMESDLSLPDIQLPPSIEHCPMDQSDEQSGQTGFQLSDFSVNAHDQSHKKSPDHLTSDQSDCQFLYQTVACQLKPTHSNCEQYVIFYKTFDCLLKTVSRKIDGLDPDKHTVDYLICLLSKVDPLTEDCEVQIYTAEGIPITCDVFLNKWTLKKRKIESGSVLFVIFTKTGLRDMTLITEEKLDHEVGMAILYVHIMMGDTYKVHVDLANDTVLTLKRKIYSATGIETSCQRLRLDDCSWKNSDDDSLDKHGVVDGQTIMVALSSLTCDNYVSKSRQFDADINTYTEQTLTGLAVFYSVLNVVISHNHSKINNKNVLGFVRKLTAFPPLVASLDLQLHQRNMNFAQKVCLVEGLYFLFRRLLPKPGTDGKDGVLDKCVFEHSASCWAYILTNANASDGASEVYKTIDLACPISCARLMEPVRINGIEEICEKAVVVKKIQDGDKVCGIVVPPSVLANVNPASDIERLLLCHPYSTTLCYVWQKPKNCLYELKDIKQESLIKMEEQILSFDYLKLYPPLKLKNPMNVPSPCLTLNSNATMVVYTGMGKDVGHSLHLYDSVKQSTQIIQADELALSLRNYPFSAVSCTKEVGKGNFTREPTEAIVVLFDTSSSMNTSCFGETMKRIDSIKQLFHAFANRSMAYNFAHIIGLTEFSSAVTVVDKCNESFEHFKNKVDNLYAYGRTLMYDAIVEGISQLNVIGKKYPNCKKRLLCLSDGLDIGSSTTLLMAAKALQV